jgi:hypothetical protein
VEAALGLLFILWFWNRPIMVLSQRGFLLAVPILLGVSSGAYFVGSSTTQECWVHYLMFQISFQMFFAALTAREYRVWAMYRNIQKGKTKKVSVVWPYVYVVLVGVAIGLIVVYTWLRPFTEFGTKPCQRTAEDKPVTAEMAQLSSTDQYFGIANHIVAFAVAFFARNVPSICSDAKVIFWITALGIVYICLSLASYHTTGATKTSFRIAYTVVDFIIQTSAICFLLFKRAKYLKLDRAGLVKKFIQAELGIYQAVAGIAPASSEAGESAAEQDPETVYTTRVELASGQFILSSKSLTREARRETDIVQV